ncbi:hypothetical protein RRG08_021003, partial [Elysia crispata]
IVGVLGTLYVVGLVLIKYFERHTNDGPIATQTGFECVWASFWRMDEDDMIDHEKIRRVITTVVWFGLTLFFGISISSIGDVIQVLSAFAAIFIFVFPGKSLLKAMQNQLESGISQPQKVYWLLRLAVLFIFVGRSSSV